MSNLRQRMLCVLAALVIGLAVIACFIPVIGVSSGLGYIVSHTPAMVFAVVFYGFMALALTRLVWPLMHWVRGGGPQSLIRSLGAWHAPGTLPTLPEGPVIRLWFTSRVTQFLRVAGYVILGLPSSVVQGFTPFTASGRHHLAMLASSVGFVLLTWLMGYVLDEPPAFTGSFIASSLVVSFSGGVLVSSCWNLLDPRSQPTQPQRLLSGIYASGAGLWAASASLKLLPASLSLVAFAVWILVTIALLAFVHQCSNRGFKGLMAHLNSLMDNPS